MTATPGNFSEVGYDTFSDADAHVVYTKTLDDASSGFVQVRTVCRRVSDGASKTWYNTVAYKKISGTLTVAASELLSSLNTVEDGPALATCSVSFQVNSGAFEVQVTGLASTEMDWAAYVDDMHVVHS